MPINNFYVSITTYVCIDCRSQMDINNFYVGSTTSLSMYSLVILWCVKCS